MNNLKLKPNQTKKAMLMLAGIALLSGTTLITTSGCSNGYRGAPAVYNTVYYHPYDYYYYPSWRVYFHISSGYYYYPNGVNWVKVRTLPPRYLLDARDRVHVVINSSKPYQAHSTHRVQYAPRPNIRYDRSRNAIERKSNINRYRNNRRR